MRSMSLFLSAVAAAGLCAAQAGAPGNLADDTLPADRHNRVDAIFSPWSGKATPGCAVGIGHNGAVDHARGYGVSNLEYDVRISPQSIFDSASVSKQFTAFAILLLAHEGKLSLEDDIRRHVPEVPAYGKPITIRQLIHHTNGLREPRQVLNLAGWRNIDLYTEADMLWAIARQGRTNFEPGAEIVYGNAGYILLGSIVRRVSGKSLRVFAEERIFKPLGMADTHFRDDHAEVVPRRASAYSTRAGGGWQIIVPNVSYNGSTGLHTTVGDLLKWGQNLIDARVGGRAVMMQMQASGRLNDGTETGYGGGLFLDRYRGLRRLWHDGMYGGYRAQAVTFPDQRLTIAALCNGSSIDAVDLVNQVADVYLGHRMTAPALAPATALPQTQPDASALAGVYWSPVTDEVVRLEWKDGALRPLGTAAALVPIGIDVFRPAQLPYEWRFRRADAGAPASAGVELAIKEWPSARVFERMSDPLPTPAELVAFTGVYRSSETDMSYTLRVVDGKLTLSWPRQYEVVLDAIGGDRFVGSRGTVSFLRDPAGGVKGLTISNRRLRRLQAERL